MSRIICVVENEAKKETGLLNEHGLALWIETEHGIVLLDTGSTPSVLTNNLDLLGLSAEDVDYLVFSHAHYDHTGGLEAILSQNTHLTIMAHPDLFRSRFSVRQGEERSIGMAMDQNTLSQRVKIKLSQEPVEILPDLWMTGEIVERPEPTGGSANLFIRDGENWQPDPYRDDISLVLKTKQGLVLICGCCHAGILNTLFHVDEHFKEPITAIIGGTHLVSADDAYLDKVIKVFIERNQKLNFHLNHCTGKKAITKLASTFGSRVKECPAGTIIDFDSVHRE